MYIDYAGPITRPEKIILGALLAYFLVIFLIMRADSCLIPNAGTGSVHAGMPYFLEAVTMDELPDGHYTVFEQRGASTWVVLHQPGPDRDFMYTVAHRPADAAAILDCGMRFQKYGTRLIA
ncbi:MAG: hypothetical protein WC505_01855 [Patescibacteria group bacterium]